MTTLHLGCVFINRILLGLFGVVNQVAVVSTKNTLYTLKNDLTAAEVLQKHFDTPCPNLWLSPDAS